MKAIRKVGSIEAAGYPQAWLVLRGLTNFLGETVCRMGQLNLRITKKGGEWKG